MNVDPIFGFQVPASVPGVPKEVLNPRNTWKDKKDYDVQAQKLARLFEENFQQFRENVPAHVMGAGPRTS
jgi:phosphoenolpyruvate carboxykinase (ATP)